ncbi:hypothetical protein CVT26_014715 [Gymnopilus dilepis]|uniref:Aminoglycoside phosphotransferase domain-containing protein n=1 Tax=Gymnopilus dilepis TaxID=231916 RepID=A0A409VWX0_9AGAR|nr:hypothetical protein CVT26_014715 [Gymnopilus dilepis]
MSCSIDYHFKFPSSFVEMRELLKDSSSVTIIQFDAIGCGARPRVVRVRPGVILKFGDYFLEDEVTNTQYARENLDIPIPRVLQPAQKLRFDDDSELATSGLLPAYYAMEEIRGVSLDTVIDKLSPDDKRSIASQLKMILRDMGALKSDKLGSVHGGPYRSIRGIAEWVLPKETFSTVAEFRDYFRRLLTEYNFPLAHIDKIMSAIPTDSSIRFTHGDLLPKNIMVEGSKLTGIIDWTYCGFFPAFWEYARMYDPDWLSEGWLEILGLVFPEKPCADEAPAISYMLNTLHRTFFA